ncbi:hypothetical protein D7322_23650 [Sphingobacterium puteale]|uniref:Uncharacterized protein n=1 Tax=Sphingobacterium puteale TaxID=2420510 RepID=A0A420VSN8_9SPHI|nr:hypothetical protein [Sphingobacterium puteale]RKO69229.1 hypothetical protein D7322_23650 [Sphingobacterium puteale]
MRSFLLIVITIIVNFTYSQAQKDPELKNALSKMTAASIASDAQATVNLTSPRLIKQMGGNERAFKLIKEGYLQLGNQGLKIDTVIHYIDLDIETLKDIEYCFFPQLIVMTIPDSSNKMIAYATLLAIKEPHISGWKFLDYGNLNDEQLKILLPDFVGKVDFPRTDIKPMMQPKEEVIPNIESLMKIIDDSVQKAKSVAAK